MQEFDPSILQTLYLPHPSSHKGQNGKLLLIGGSHLFHAASLWALKIASRIVDMVFYASVPENDLIVHHAKQEFRDGIVIKRENIENYIEEADAILIGPGMVRTELRIKNKESRKLTIKEINELTDEGEQTYYLTHYLLSKYPEKKWVVDAGALQMLELSDLEKAGENAILTPHPLEFQRIFDTEATEKHVQHMAKIYNTTILLKGKEDIVSSEEKAVHILGGNPGMTKGGTGDVLAGLTASLYTKNNAFLSAAAASYINKKAGDSLFKKVGYYFNASDLVDEIPHVLKDLLLDFNA